MTHKPDYTEEQCILYSSPPAVAELKRWLHKIGRKESIRPSVESRVRIVKKMAAEQERYRKALEKIAAASCTITGKGNPKAAFIAIQKLAREALGEENEKAQRKTREA